MQTIEKYGLFELRVKGPAEPTTLYPRRGTGRIPVKCFRISEQEFAIRFMPREEGIWKYHVGDNSGEFLCTQHRKQPWTVVAEFSISAMPTARPITLSERRSM